MKDVWKKYLGSMIIRRIAKWLIGLLAVGYIAICSWFYFYQEYVLFAPNTDPTDLPTNRSDRERTGPEFRQGWFHPLDPKPEAEIHYREYRAKDSAGVILFLPGNRGNLQKCRFQPEVFIEAGYDVWTMEYRKYGYSEGLLSEEALLDDAQTMYDIVKEKHKEQAIVVWGRSLGSGMAAYIASKNKPRMLVLETPYYSLVDCVRNSYPFIPEALFRYKFPTHNYLDTVACHAHLIHGDADEKIYYGSSKKLEELHGSKVTVHTIEGGKHNLRTDNRIRSTAFDEKVKLILGR